MSGLSDPRILYGVHSISPYSRADKTPYGILKVIGNANLALTSAIDELYGGANKYAWAAENKTVSTALKCKVKAYPGFLFTLFLGATVTDTGVDAAGTVTAPVNAQGTSAFGAVGVASIAVKAAKKANVKFGSFVAKVLTSSTLGIFLLSDIDATRGGTGNGVAFTDDTLLLALATVTITATVGTDIDSLGLTLTGGAGPILMVVGDTFTFTTQPLSTKSSSIVVGRSTDTFPAFGALLLSQKRATGEMFEINAHNCVGGGLPIDFAENAFSQPELAMTCLYDSALDRVFTIRSVEPS